MWIFINESYAIQSNHIKVIKYNEDKAMSGDEIRFKISAEIGYEEPITLISDISENVIKMMFREFMKLIFGEEKPISIEAFIDNFNEDIKKYAPTESELEWFTKEAERLKFKIENIYIRILEGKKRGLSNIKILEEMMVEKQK